MCLAVLEAFWISELRELKILGPWQRSENFLTFVFKVTQAIGIKESVNKNRCFDLLVTSVSSYWERGSLSHVRQLFGHFNSQAFKRDITDKNLTWCFQDVIPSSSKIKCEENDLHMLRIYIQKRKCWKALVKMMQRNVSRARRRVKCVCRSFSFWS